MNRTAPFLVAALVFGAAALWSLHLALTPDPFAQSSALAIVVGLVLFGLIAMTGLLLSRGRWARYLSLGLVATTLLLALFAEPGPWYVAGLAVSGLALVGLTGPWLQGWIRRFASAEGPGTAPTVLVLGALGLVPLVGVAAPSGLDVSHGILGGAGILLAWAYARTELWALWGMRVALPIVAVGAVVQSPWGGRALIVAAVGSLTALAWTDDAGRAVRPLLDRLPGPRVATPPDGSES